ncbi:transglycosylase SLT domain-containing protein [Balneola sp. MJW-20]|uniref:transglycosylase SLT domain-containing protein n=1 Tax=Gracilimonas aurantiaca TaxID=3234185 RepID=UPI00390AF364
MLILRQVRRVISFLFIGSVLFVLVHGCDRSSEPEQINEDVTSTFPYEVGDPIEKDFAEIKRSGVLRMITSYSSGSYFLHRGIQVGFEYELLRAFARENDLALEVVIPTQDESPYELLNSGRGDIIAANYSITSERREVVDFTRPYNLVDQLIVVSDEVGFQPESIHDLEGIPISVRRNSSYYVRLMELKEEGFPIQINILPEDMDTESVLFQIANGQHAATVADDNIFQASNKYMDGLVMGPLIAEQDTVAWAIRKNSPDFETKLNQFLYKHFRFNEEGVPKRSALLNVLRRKYFEEGTQISNYFSPEYQTEQYGTISPYDNLIKEIADEFGLDWVMLTAIAAQESKFDPKSISWAGAVGIMQVLPRFSDVSEDSLYIPEVNIREGAKILSEHLEHYAYLDSTNQWSFALATYNAGLGHVADARRLSIDRNDNPNEWGSISESLLMLMQRKYYENARYGFCRGIETVKYVNEIMNRYNTYMAILTMAEGRRNYLQGAGTIFGMQSIRKP